MVETVQGGKGGEEGWFAEDGLTVLFCNREWSVEPMGLV